MRRTIRHRWLLVGMVTASVSACDKAPTSTPQVRKFDRPAILIGAAGGFVTMPLRTRINWL